MYSFGPFQLDSDSRRLSRGDEAVTLAERHLEVLLQLVAHPGSVLSKDALIETAWRGVAVTDNSLEQAVSALRRVLGDTADGTPYIQTVPRQGYRFAAGVSRSVRRESDAHLDALLAPHRAWLEGQSSLETLERERVADAQKAFRRALEAAPGFALPHIGLANACVFRFESTRSDLQPDGDALGAAVRHAREACRLDPGLAEAWATLGFVLRAAGDAQSALAASRRAVTLEPDNWRHQLRLAFVGWGEERLRAASRALHLLPGLGLAHFLAATVHVARQSFTAAERELAAGAAAQDEQLAGRTRFAAVGLHWLRGLVRLREGDVASARESFERELAFERTGHLYTRECCAHTHYALGALAVRAGDRASALAAFDRALACAGGHVMPLAAKAALEGGGDSGALLDARLAAFRAHGLTIDAEVAASVRDVLHEQHEGAASRVHRAIAEAPVEAQGWLIPVDPLLNVDAHGDAWATVLAALRARAA